MDGVENCSDTISFIVLFFQNLFSSAIESEFSLTSFANLAFFLTARKKYFHPHTILKGLTQIIARISGLSWEQEIVESLKVGSMIVLFLPQ